MRLNNNFKGGWKPITIAMGLMAGTSANLYADVDQFSKVNTVLSNSYITSRYIQDFDNQSEMMMNDRLRFYRHYKQWDE
ncbi:MAG: hypothetical protein IKQ62_02570, partial [Bacteroidaceae bacterium]|nr:hypothetical protein [Bacteroidaceae bacterium]